MAHKCDGCFFKIGWEDDNGRFPICERHYWDFTKARNECIKTGPCKYYLTDEEANKIVAKLDDIPSYHHYPLEGETREVLYDN